MVKSMLSSDLSLKEKDNEAEGSLNISSAFYSMKEVSLQVSRSKVRPRKIHMGRSSSAFLVEQDL